MLPEEQQPQKTQQLNPTNAKKSKQSCRWTIEENYQYIQALKQVKKAIFNGQLAKKNQKPYKMMEEILRIDKRPEQIRGHHKKMIQKYATIENIIVQLAADLRIKQAQSEKQGKKIQDIEEQYFLQQEINFSEHYWPNPK